ncbi:hypothetical protein ACGRL8_08490 [Vibrio rumoiensis]|uniref:hypothetical protein n=1 Tax=Vibrio rumoiensis TaxID=76258 RepID=UPI003748FF9B
MTAQVTERLIYKGEEVSLHSEPNFPLDHPEIITLTSKEGMAPISACRRGYVGTWEIKGRSFFLNHLQGKYKLKTTPISADWFSGQLIIPESGKAEYIHGGWGYQYSQNKIITVVAGMVTNIEYQDKTVPEFIDSQIKIRLNCTLGAIAEASVNCCIQPNENDEGNKLVVFFFEQQSVLEAMTGKLVVAAQESKVSLPIATYIAKPNLAKAHMLTVSVSLRWAVELEKMFMSNHYSDIENSVNHINGFWLFSMKEEKNTPNSGDNLWGSDIPF